MRIKVSFEMEVNDEFGHDDIGEWLSWELGEVREITASNILQDELNAENVVWHEMD